MELEFIIKDEVNKFFQKDGKWENFLDGAVNFKNDLETELYNHNESKSKFIFLNEVLRILKERDQEHLKTCKFKDNPDQCTTNKFHAKATYFAKQIISELKGNGITYEYDYEPQDPISEDEKVQLSTILDEILERLQKIEVGQDITYTDIMKEIEEMKELLDVLGKKNWFQTLKGKMIDLGLASLTSEGLKVIGEKLQDIDLLGQ